MWSLMPVDRTANRKPEELHVGSANAARAVDLLLSQPRWVLGREAHNLRVPEEDRGEVYFAQQIHNRALDLGLSDTTAAAFRKVKRTLHEFDENFLQEHKKHTSCNCSMKEQFWPFSNSVMGN